jgi:hypothetical protein
MKYSAQGKLNIGQLIDKMMTDKGKKEHGIGGSFYVDRAGFVKPSHSESPEDYALKAEMKLSYLNGILQGASESRRAGELREALQGFRKRSFNFGELDSLYKSFGGEKISGEGNRKDYLKGRVDRKDIFDRVSGKRFGVPTEAADVSERQTKIPNLVIISAGDLVYSQSALMMYRRVKQLDGDLKGASFELDKNLQPFLDKVSQDKGKVSYEEFPGFGYTLNYCANNGIRLFASDELSQHYLRRLELIDTKLKDLFKKSAPAKLSDVLSEWEEARRELGRKRAEKVVQRLRKISKEVDGQLVHLASESQAAEIGKLI